MFILFFGLKVFWIAYKQTGKKHCLNVIRKINIIYKNYEQKKNNFTRIKKNAKLQELKNI